MSIAEKLTELNTIKTNLFTAISEKGVVIPEGSGLKDCPHMVENIPYVNNGWENSYAIINGHKYPTIKKGGVEWLAQNLDEVFEGMELSDTFNQYTDGGLQCYRKGAIITDYTSGSLDKLVGVGYRGRCRSIITANVSNDGWRIPSKTDFNNLFNSLNVSTDLCNPLWPCYYSQFLGTNGTGFNLLPLSDGFSDLGQPNNLSHLMTSASGDNENYMVWASFLNAEFSEFTGQSSWNNIAFCRLVRNY